MALSNLNIFSVGVIFIIFPFDSVTFAMEGYRKQSWEKKELSHKIPTRSDPRVFNIFSLCMCSHEKFR